MEDLKEKQPEMVYLDSLSTDSLLKTSSWNVTSLQVENEEESSKGKKNIHKCSLKKNESSVGGKIKSKVVAFIKNKYNLIFIVILFLTLLLRLKYIGQESIWNDAAVHLWYSAKVTMDPLFFLNPIYFTGDYAIPQSIVAIFYFFTKNAFLAGKIVAVLYALTGVTLMYLLGAELKNKLFGVVAALILAFNHIFWFYSVRPLADSPLLVATIFVLYAVVKLEKEKTLFWGVVAGFSFLVAMFTKTQSVLFVFPLLIYYLLFKRKEMIKNKPHLFSWVIPTGFVLIVDIGARLFLGSSFLDRVFGLFLTTRGMPFGFEAFGMVKWIFGWYLLVFAALGVILVILYKEKKYYFPIILFAFYYFFFEINVDNTQDRYILPLLSIGIILAVFAVQEIGYFISLLVKDKRKYFQVFLIIGFAIFLSWQYYGIGGSLIQGRESSYAGHPEAGAWLQENVPDDTPIFAGSPRMVRAFVGRDFAGPDEWTNGGSIWYLRGTKYMDNKSAFVEDVEKLSKKSDVYVELDIWEYTQPKWYFPITQESIDQFSELGFNLVHVVYRDVNTNKGKQKMPVIFILKKDQVI